MRGCLRHAIAREPADVSRERESGREREFGSEILCSYAAEPLQRGLVLVWSGLVSASEPDQGVFCNFVHGGFSSVLVEGGKSFSLPDSRTFHTRQR
jgi:hypothetical protein